MPPQIPDVLVEQFERLQVRLRAVSATGGIGLTLLLVSAIVGLALLFDLLLDLPVSVRVGMLIGSILMAILGALFWVIRPISQKVPDAELAAFVEAQFPEFEERLLSTVELNSEIEETSASPVMQKWVQQETVRYAKRFDFASAVDATRAIRRCWWGGTALLVLLLPLVFAGESYAVLVSRFLNPWGNYERIQNLILTVENGDRVVAEKTDVIITAIPSWRFKEGTFPASAWLEWTDAKGITDARRLDWNEESGNYQGTLPRVASSFTYHVAAERSRSQTYRIAVVPLPRIDRFEIEISPPPYTGSPAQFHDLALGEIMVVEQSLWDLALWFNKPVVEAKLLWLDSTSAPHRLKDATTLADGTQVSTVTELSLNSDHTSAQLSETLALDSPTGRFVIRAIDEHGLASETDVVRRLTILPDTPPLIQFADAEENASARPNDIINLPVTVSDDFGVATLELYYEIIRSEAVREQGILEAEDFVAGELQLSHTFRFDLAPLQVESGMRVSLRGRATDERPVPGPNESWTITRNLMIQDDAKPYGAQTLAEQQKSADQVFETLKTELEQQSEKAKELEQAAQNANAMKQDWKEDARAQMLQEKLETLQQQLEQLSALFEQDPLFAKIGEQTRQIAQGNLQQANESVAQAQQAELGEKPQQFADAAERLQTASEQLGEMQQKFQQLADLQRDLLELNRLANQTERLANSVESLEQRQQQQQVEQGQETAQQNDPPSPQPISEQSTQPSSQQMSAEQNATAQKQQRAEQQQWEADQRKAWEDHQQLSQTLDDLFERRPELITAATESLEAQLKELAQRAEKLAQQQRQLANAAKQDAEELAQQLSAVQEQQANMKQAAEEFAAKLPSNEQKETLAAAQQLMQQAEESVRRGDATNAAQQQQQAQDQFENLASKLQQDAATAAESGEPKPELNELAQQAQQLANQLQQSMQQLEEQIPGSKTPAEPDPSNQPPVTSPQQNETPQQAPALAQSSTSEQTAPTQPTPSPQQTPNPPALQGDAQPAQGTQNQTEPQQAEGFLKLPEKQQAVANLAEQLQATVQDLVMPDEEISAASAEFAEQSQQSAQKSQMLEPLQASESAQQAAQAAQKLAEALGNSQAPDALQQAAQAAAEEQSELAQSLQEFAENKQAQQQMRSELQQQIHSETQTLAQELGQRSQELAANPINQQAQSQQGQESQKLAEQASQQMAQAKEQSLQKNQGQASESAEQAAQSLSAATQKAYEASNQPSQAGPQENQMLSESSGKSSEGGPSGQQPSGQQPSGQQPGGQQGAESSVPGEVGDQVAQAARQLKSAGEVLQKLGTPVPGTPGEKTAENQNNDQQGDPEEGMNGGEGQGQQRGEQKSSQSGQQPSSSEALRQAAQSMRQAAGKMGLGQSQPQPNSQQQAQDSSEGTGNESSDFGSNQQLAQLMKLQSELMKETKRDWGQLPGTLQTELLESSQKQTSGDYSRLVRRYFNDISKARTPVLNDKNK